MSKKCFVLCPISDEQTDIRKRSDQLLKHIITPVCHACGFENPERVDLIANPDSITNKILECLSTYDLVMVDITDHNPNVFYELGYRSALGKPLIQLKSKADSIPFDVSNINTFDYALDDLDEVEKTRERLIATIKSFDFDNLDTKASSKPINQQHYLSNVLQELYQIKDDIEIIKEQTKSTDIGAISVLADKLTANSQKTDNQVLMETMIPKLLDNPESFMALFELSKKINK